MILGTVKKITDKGFGFITVEGRQKDLFFHAIDCKMDFKSLQEGDEVEFEGIDPTPKGEQAFGVALA